MGVEVDAAMDTAFGHGLTVTALHNHFFYDEPKVYFMHIGGRGPAPSLAAGVKAVCDAIKQIRAANPQPAVGFPGAVPAPGGTTDAKSIERITGGNGARERSAPRCLVARFATRCRFSGWDEAASP